MFKRHHIEGLYFDFKGRKYYVDHDFMSFAGQYRQAKADMVRSFLQTPDIKSNLAEFSQRIMPIIFGQSQADELLKLFGGDHVALFYRVSPWIRRRLHPVMRREIRERKRQYLRFMGE